MLLSVCGGRGSFHLVTLLVGRLVFFTSYKHKTPSKFYYLPELNLLKEINIKKKKNQNLTVNSLRRLPQADKWTLSHSAME